jgi:hypothetical protein
VEVRVNVPFVDWEVDHKKRLIHVTIRLDVWRVEPGVLYENLAKQIFPAVERKWTGKFKCYDFKLTIDWRFVSSLEHVRDNALDVRMSDELMERGYTRAEGNFAPNSDDPKDQVVAIRDPSNDSLRGTTAWPYAMDTVSHEIGHVLGLEEGYVRPKLPWYDFWSDDPPPEPIPGHPDDVMQHPTSPVLPSTIVQLLRRQFGRSLEQQMHCPLGLRSGPAELNLLLASISDVRLDVKTDRYDPPTNDPQAPSEPSTFTGTFHAAGEYLTQLGIPLGASGELEQPVTFKMDLSHEPIALRIDLGFWILKQQLRWDPVSSLPYAEGALLIEANGSTLDSSLFWPGPPLLAEFYDPDKETPNT